MIINIRGTNGAGKTHLVRRLMDLSGNDCTVQWGDHPEKIGRKVVLGHLYAEKSVIYMGSYDAVCGGCDRFSWKGAADWLQQQIEVLALNHHVVFEGLMVNEWKSSRFQAMDEFGPLHIVLLDTPLKECIDSVNKRRSTRGVDELADTRLLTNKWIVCHRKLSNERKLGLSVRTLNREVAFRHCRDLLGLEAT